METREYSAQIVSAKIVRLQMSAVGRNQTRYVIEEEMDIYPYDPKTLTSMINGTLIFPTQVIVQGFIKTRHAETGHLIQSDRPQELQKGIDFMHNQLIVAHMIGEDVDWEAVPEEDQFLKYCNAPIEKVFAELKLQPESGIPFYQVNLEAPDNKTIFQPTITFDLPYYGKIRDAVLEKATAPENA